MSEHPHQADAHDARDAYADTAIRQALVLADAVVAGTEDVSKRIEELSSGIDKVVMERNALRSVLQAIVQAYDQTYDATCDGDGVWIAAASIPVAVMHRAEQLLHRHRGAIMSAKSRRCPTPTNTRVCPVCRTGHDLPHCDEQRSPGPCAHTPGPWVAMNDGTKAEPMMSVKAARIAGRPPNHCVAVVSTGDSPQEMENANALLIAAAPGLLSAAEIALVELDAVEREIGVPSKAVPMLRTALAKARGEA